jgi:carboxymethylenebutenolidase
MGGRLVGELAATGAELSAGVIHYGSPPKLDLVPNITAALEGHYASTDAHITGKVPAFAAAMKAAGREFSYYVYDADHGFSLNDRFPAARETAMRRSSTFLDRHLRPQNN